MLYERENRELWYYDENGNLAVSHYSRNGVRQSCVLGAFFFCLAMYPVYARIQALLGPDVALYGYCDDVYLFSDVARIEKPLATAPAIYKKAGLRIGWGPGKTELVLSPGCYPVAFLSQLEATRAGLSHLVLGFSSCLGVPRHVFDDSAFVTSALTNLGVRHNRVLDLVEDITDEDPFVTLWLLQVCGLSRFGHIIGVVPPSPIHDFATARDDVVTSAFAAFQQEPPSPDFTHSFPDGTGGASLASLARHASGGYLGAFFRLSSPL